MFNSKLSKKSVKRRSLKLKNKKTRSSKRRVVKNMKGGVGIRMECYGSQIYIGSGDGSEPELDRYKIQLDFKTKSSNKTPDYHLYFVVRDNTSNKNYPITVLNIDLNKKISSENIEMMGKMRTNGQLHQFWLLCNYFNKNYTLLAKTKGYPEHFKSRDDDLFKMLMLIDKLVQNSRETGLYVN